MFIDEKTGKHSTFVPSHKRYKRGKSLVCAVGRGITEPGAVATGRDSREITFPFCRVLHDELHCLVLPVAAAPGSVFVVPRQGTVGQKNNFYAKPFRSSGISTVMLLVETPSAP